MKYSYVYVVKNSDRIILEFRNHYLIFAIFFCT